MSKMSVKELEEVLLNQIELLNDPPEGTDAEEMKSMIERSQSIASLTTAFVEVQRTKLDVVKELNRSGDLYKNYLGIESEPKIKSIGGR